MCSDCGVEGQDCGCPGRTYVSWLHWLHSRVWICLDWIEINQDQSIPIHVDILQTPDILIFPDLSSPNNLWNHVHPHAQNSHGACRQRHSAKEAAKEKPAEEVATTVPAGQIPLVYANVFHSSINTPSSFLSHIISFTSNRKSYQNILGQIDNHG